MKIFIVLYHAPMSAMAQTVRQLLKNRQRDGRLDGLGSKKCNEKLVDMGTPLMNLHQLYPHGTSRNSAKNMDGYSVLLAENLKEAKKLLKGHPHLSWNAACNIEVNETWPLPCT